MEVYKHICSLVANFNYLFGVISYKYPNSNSVEFNKFNSFSESFNKSQVNLRCGLINEEIKELEQAIKDKNPIEIVDALCDILYVVAGAKVYFNLPIDNKITTDTDNMQNITNTLDLLLKKSDITFIESVVSMEDEIVNKILNEILDYNNVLGNLTELFVNERKKEYHKLFVEHFIKFYDETLDKIVVNVFSMSKLFNLNIVHLFEIVHNSNMTKICENEENANETVEWYKINESRYKEPSYRKIHFNDKDYFVIYDIETKKILKSIKYIPAKFT